MNLRELREAAGLTMSAAAAEAGVSTSTISHAERGRMIDGERAPANLSLKTVTTLLRVYGEERTADMLDGVPTALKPLRERQGLSRAELADAAEAPGIYTARAVQAIELGTNKPTVEQLASFCLVLGHENAGANKIADMLTELVRPTTRKPSRVA
ncbi:helix-turn-helix DNA binding domain protein [Streptomyces phage Mischief19]|nr:helix-turn-helix DNA binding domain protein [Streptomyces phage Mischief19]